MASSPPVPVSAPPSVGGMALSAVSGFWLGSGLSPVLQGGGHLPLTAWLPPLLLLGMVGVLLGGVQVARARLGVPMTPAAQRRQRLAMGGALLVGLLSGVLVGGALSPSGGV